ncbi:hypothetical protein AYI70_g1130 [Smittium culicis]|uniref:F-box domain-containing protein n=1 Tax=Smittium culicis TaxID=133412 RepID=A0A1R1YDX1_9FUNG|nr:hypothetical protein AYI70_g1130 [Smittium culicis]
MESLILKNDNIQKKLFSFLDLDTIMELRLINKSISEVATMKMWETVTEDHYELEEFESLMIKNAHHIVKLAVNNMDDQLNATKVAYLLDRLVRIESIEFKYFASFKLIYKFLEGLASKFLTQIKSVDVSLSGMNEMDHQQPGMPKRSKLPHSGYDNGILSLIAKFPNLESVIISEVDIPGSEINQMFINMTSKNINTIALRIFGPLEPETFQVIKAKYAKTLKSVEIGGMESTSIATEFEKLLMECRNLEQLVTGPIHAIPNNFSILGNLAPHHCPKLNVLDLSTHDFADQYNKFLDQDWSSVKNLYFSGSTLSHKTSQIIISSFKKIASIGFIEVQEMTSESLKMILDSIIKKLKSLQLIALNFPLENAWSNYNEFSMLERLMLVHLNLSNSTLCDILSKSKALNELVLEGVKLSNYQTVIPELNRLKQSNNLYTKNLKTLVIANDPNVTYDFASKFLQTVNVNLFDVDLKGNNIDPAEFEDLMDDFPNISFDFQEDFEQLGESDYDDDLSSDFSSSGEYNNIMAPRNRYDDDVNDPSKYEVDEESNGNYAETTENAFPEDNTEFYSNPLGLPRHNKSKSKKSKNHDNQIANPIYKDFSKSNNENDVD